MALLLLDGAFAVMSYACSLVEQVRPPFSEPEFQHSWNLGGLKTSFLGGEGGGRKKNTNDPPPMGGLALQVYAAALRVRVNTGECEFTLLQGVQVRQAEAWCVQPGGLLDVLVF